MQHAWEYKTLAINVFNGHVHDDTMEEQLNAMGQDGWELSHVTPLELESKTTCIVHHFRRPAERQRAAGFQPS